MIRSSAIISFAVSLLLWSGQVLSSEPHAANIQGSGGTADSATVHPVADCPHTVCPSPCPTHGRHCPRLVHRHAAGQPCPLTHGLGQRLGRDDGRSVCPILAPQPLPMPPVGGFFGTLGTPRQYQYDQPYMYPPMSMPSAYPMQVPSGHSMQAGQAAAVPPMQVPAPAGFPAAYPQGQSGQGYPGYMMPPANERIVYIPYAMPPPITVERLAKALPIPKPLTLRRILGDAYMYEYPEMPLHLYTTRGPRDFLAPNPPGIGE